MARDHIIPKFILKGFAINPDSNPTNQKVRIFDMETLTVKTEKIDDAYAIRNFNSHETEKFLANEYESDVAKIFQRIKQDSENGNNHINLSSEEYRLLFRFFIIMWRRNDIQTDNIRYFGNQFEDMMRDFYGENYRDMLKPEYRETNFNEMFDMEDNKIIKTFYDKVIRKTTDDDPTVQKTIRNYFPVIIHNKSNIHFLLHNSYNTLRYTVPYIGYQPNDFDMPYCHISPISNNLCFCLWKSAEEIDIEKSNFKIPIEVWERDEDIKEYFIKGYITDVAKSFVVDDTNIELLKEYTQPKNYKSQ